MKGTCQYKDFTLKVSREKCMGGWDMTYLVAIRESDGLVLDYMEDSNETLKTYFDILKLRVDERLEEEAEQETKQWHITTRT